LFSNKTVFSQFYLQLHRNHGFSEVGFKLQKDIETLVTASNSSSTLEQIYMLVQRSKSYVLSVKDDMVFAAYVLRIKFFQVLSNKGKSTVPRQLYSMRVYTGLGVVLD